MANEVIGIEVAVKLDQLRAQLATLGPGMEKEAAAMTAALNKQLKAQTAAVKQQTAAMTAAQRGAVKQIGDEAAAAGTKFDKLGKAMGPIGGVLSRISPEAGAVASSIAGLTSGIEGLGGAGVLSAATLAPLVAILAPLALGVGLVVGLMRDSTERSENAAKAMEGLGEAMRVVKEMTEGTADAMSDLRVKMGEITQADAQYEKKVKALATEYTKANAEIEESIRLRVEAGKAEGLLDDVAALREQQVLLSKSTVERGVALAMEAEYSEALAQSEAFIKARDKAAAAGAKAAEKATREATEAEREAAKEAKEIADEAARVNAEAVANQEELFRQQGERRLAQMAADREAFTQRLADAQREFDDKKKKAEDEKKLISDVKSAAISAISDVMSAIGTFASLAADATASAATKSADRLDNLRGLLSDLRAETVDAATLSGDALVQAFKRGEVSADDLSEAQKESIDAVLSAAERAAAKRAKVERKAAIEAFETQQAVNIASAVVAGALAVLQAFAQLGPIAGGIAAVGIAATTAASIASIEAAKPSFHRGGIVSEAGQGEVSARLLPNEAVLNRQAAASLGAGGVHALNAGASMGGVSLRIGRLEAREIVRTDIAAGGLIVRTAKAAAATGGNTAGRTGRRPIA